MRDGGVVAGQDKLSGYVILRSNATKNLNDEEKILHCVQDDNPDNFCIETDNPSVICSANASVLPLCPSGISPHSGESPLAQRSQGVQPQRNTNVLPSRR